MIFKNNTLIFSTGKTVYCHAGIVGILIEPSGQLAPLSYGYDGGINTVIDPEYDPEYDEDNSALTVEECIELAEHMIDTWQMFLKMAQKTKRRS